MREEILRQSYLLGDFVGIVQSMEDAVEGAVPKGNHWGEHLLPLFTANMDSSMQLTAKIITHLPHTLTIKNGKEVSIQDLKVKLEALDIDILKKEIDEEEYVKGYKSWFGERISETTEQMEGSPNQCYNLGVFMANLQTMEEAISVHQGDFSGSKIEDILLLLETNFESTMQIVDKVLARLPETIVFQGRDLSIKQLIQARSRLDFQTLSSMPLDHDQFQRGYHFQRKEFLT